MAEMNLTIVNPSTSGATDAEVYITIIGDDPSTNAPSYLDLSSSPPALKPFSSYQSTMSQTLAALPASSSGGIQIPAIRSARLYISVGSDFSGVNFPYSGPSASKDTLVLFDKVEFDTSTPGLYNVNATSVDFYGVSYTLTAIPTGATVPVTVGFTDTREKILTALYDIPLSPSGQASGNTNTFQSCFMFDGAGNILRVLAPKAMALTDWAPLPDVTRATQWSHFFDTYVHKAVFQPERVFSFYTKNWTPENPGPTIWAKVSPDGETVFLYTDPGLSNPYTVASLPRPMASPGKPSFAQHPTSYHNVIGNAADEIDWGFLLGGNANPDTGMADNWGSDPAAMALMVSICRGVAHLPGEEWLDADRYYQGTGNGQGTEEFPIFWYARLLHQMGVGGKAYALSYDDVYGENPSIFFDENRTVTLTLNDLSAVKFEEPGDVPSTAPVFQPTTCVGGPGGGAFFAAQESGVSQMVFTPLVGEATFIKHITATIDGASYAWGMEGSSEPPVTVPLSGRTLASATLYHSGFMGGRLGGVTLRFTDGGSVSVGDTSGTPTPVTGPVGVPINGQRVLGAYGRSGADIDALGLIVG